MKKILLLAATLFCFINFINAQAGQLDPSFGINGIVKTHLGKNYNYQVSYVRQILPQPDGNMYIVQGPFSGSQDEGKKSLTRRHADGSIDSGFGLIANGFSAEAGFDISRAAVQPDGKIVVIGSVKSSENANVDQTDFAVARFKADGSLDAGFADHGKLITDFGTTSDIEESGKSRDEGYSVAVQKDGKIIAAGFSNGYLALSRYNTDGSLDNTFSDDGLLITSVYHTFGYPDPISIAFQNDNKIVVAGGFSEIIRFNVDGSIDKLINDENHFFDAVYSEAIQKDGKIIVADFSSWGLGLARYNIDGSLDTSFSNDGIQKLDYGTEVVLQNDQKIVVAGDSIGGYFTIYRFNPDGSFDNTFSNNGRQETYFGYGYNQPYAAAIQSDGKILVGGAAMPLMAISRYNTDGSLDNTFGKDGKLTDSAHLGKAAFYKTIVQKDGKIIASGKAWNGSAFEFVIARYNTNGSLDNSFSADGILTTGITTQYENKNDFSIALQKDGKIVAARDNYLIRYNADGSADNTFAANGVNTPIYIGAVTIQNDGKILVAGGEDFTWQYGRYRYPSIIRYNSDGSVDKTFGFQGQQTVILNSAYGSASSVVIQSDEKIVMAGFFGGNNVGDNVSPFGPVILIRLNPDGSLDNTFGKYGISNFAPYIYVTSCSIALQRDDKIVVAGGSNTELYAGGIFLSRLNIDGSIDSNFIGITPLVHSNVTFGSTAIALQADGKIVVSGSDLLRFNTNGSIDSTFDVNAKREVDFDIQDIAIANDKLYAAGGTYYGSVATYWLDNDSSNAPPIITLIAPADHTTRLAPAAHIKLSAAASDADGTITKVEFYNGNKLLHTETVAPYGYVWTNVGLGNYTLTAKAYDNSGNVTTSAPVHISVVPNKPPVVSITKPVNNQSFAAPGYIHLEAAASDTDGRITNVKFYNGITLLRTEYEYPYTYHWENIPVGTYTITAVATDNWGAHTTSAPVTIRIKSAKAMIVSNKAVNDKIPVNDKVSVKLYPNPAANIVNLYTSGMQQSKPADISIISVSGIVLKKVQTGNAAQMQLDVSSLAKGVYTIKIVSGDKVIYKQLVKL